MITIPKISVNIKLFTFCLFNLLYVTYMNGYTSRGLYLVTLCVFCAVCILEYYSSPRIALFNNIVRSMASYIILIAVITFCIQLVNFRFELFQWTQFLYWILPLVAGYYWFNTTSNENRIVYFYIFFARFLLDFILSFGSDFNISNIVSISWSDSMSSVFESSDAHNFLFLVMVFLYFDKKWLALISAFFCMLSFKRLSFILAIALLIGYRFIREKPVGKKVKWITIIIFSLSPFLISWLLTPGASAIFSKINIDLNEFSSGRISMIQYVLNNIGTFNGFGSMNAYLSDHPYGTYHFIYIMHSDFYMIFKECSIVAVVYFCYKFVSVSSNNWKVFLLCVYICMEMVTSTFFQSITTWMILYMFMMVVYERDSLLSESELIQ